MYQLNHSPLADCVAEKVTDILSGEYQQHLTVMQLFSRISKLFQFSSVKRFLCSIEKHLVPQLIISRHKDVQQVRLGVVVVSVLFSFYSVENKTHQVIPHAVTRQTVSLLPYVCCLGHFPCEKEQKSFFFGEVMESASIMLAT